MQYRRKLFALGFIIHDVLYNTIHTIIELISPTIFHRNCGKLNFDTMDHRFCGCRRSRLRGFLYFDGSFEHYMDVDEEDDLTRIQVELQEVL